MEKTRKKEIIERILALSNRQFEALLKMWELKQEDLLLLKGIQGTNFPLPHPIRKGKYYGR